MSKPMFKKIIQIGLVVRNAEETAKRCWDDLGIGPWKFYTFTQNIVSDATFRGRRIEYATRIGHANIGGIDWEIIEPLDDQGMVAEHLRVRGEGIHHICFDVENYEETRSHLLTKGYDEVCAAKWAGNPFSFFDAQKSLACVFEIWSPPSDTSTLPKPDASFP